MCGLPFPSPGDLPDPGINAVSPESPALVGGFLTTEPSGKFLSTVYPPLVTQLRFCGILV